MTKTTERSNVGIVVRFACGAVIGLLIGLWLATSITWDNLRLWVATTVLAGIAGGLLAVKCGSRFLEAVGRLRWLIP